MSNPTSTPPTEPRPDPARRAAAALGALFAYPRRERFAIDLARAEGRLLAAGQDGAAEALDAFERAVARLPFEELEDLYTRTFDLTPVCVPFLSVHLFGQESFRRARLMTGLDEAYQRAGFDRASELPDHVGVVLRAAEVFPDEEWRELVEKVLARPLARMAGALGGTGPRKNPYRHLVEAARRLLGVDELPAEAPAEPHWRRKRVFGGTP
jgi:nitrate reductase assembly molybdenum cofactor insertion protein NarJ